MRRPRVTLPPVVHENQSNRKGAWGHVVRDIACEVDRAAFHWWTTDPALVTCRQCIDRRPPPPPGQTVHFKGERCNFWHAEPLTKFLRDQAVYQADPARHFVCERTGCAGKLSKAQRAHGQLLHPAAW